MKNLDILWVDVETTGLLESSTDQILELSAIITDQELEIIGTFPSYIVKASSNALDNMNEWSQECHARSGLLEAVEQSEYTLTSLEEALESFLDRHGLYTDIVVAGNSIALDKRFMQKDLPNIYSRFSHRVVDVSSFAEMVKRWKPDLYKGRPRKTSKHRAEPDIQESLEELLYYREILPML